MTETEKTIQFKEEDGLQICFINTHRIPESVTRHPQFRYVDGIEVGNSQAIKFFQLCTYRYTNGYLYYDVLTWEEIKVPSYKISLFKLACDAMKGLL